MDYWKYAASPSFWSIVIAHVGHNYGWYVLLGWTPKVLFFLSLSLSHSLSFSLSLQFHFQLPLPFLSTSSPNIFPVL